MKKIFIIGLSIFFITVFTANVFAQPSTDSENGKKIYDKYCLSCHGDKGDGKGKMAKALKPAPPDFTDKALMGSFDDKYLFEIISEGGKAKNKSALMGTFKDKITESEIKDVVSYIKSFAK